MVRSSSTGQTCAIDQNGRIIAEAPPFKEAWINAAVPLAKKDTLYTLYGDYLGVFFVFAALTLLLFGVIYYIIKRHGYSKKDINRR
jgi:apolipoprotein N-acyltransferase